MSLTFLSSAFKKSLKDSMEPSHIVDDVLVFGCDYSSFKSNIIGFLDLCVEKDLHPNPDKIQINIPNVPFFGQILTKEGLKLDPHKISVIQQ